MKRGRVRNVATALAVVFASLAMGTLLVRALYMPQPSRTCEAVRHWTGTGAPGAAFPHPMGLAWGGGGLYVADAEHGAVQRYTPDGTLQATWTGLGRPVAVAVAESLVYVADFLGDRIVVLGPAGAVRSWGRHGVAAGDFDAPSGIAVDRAGSVYVTDFYNHRVEVFTSDGRFLRAWGGRGRLHGAFHFPTAVAVSPRDGILVADGFNHRVQRFTADGRSLATWGGMGYGIAGAWPGWFALAKDVAVDSAGTVYVTDAFNGRVQSFTTDGKLVAVWGGGSRERRPLRYASGIAAGPQGRVYVGDFYGSQIWELDCH